MTKAYSQFQPADPIRQNSRLFTGMKAFSWVVAIGTILAGAIGVGNIMLIVVKERTREIGYARRWALPPAHRLDDHPESLFITVLAGLHGAGDRRAPDRVCGEATGRRRR